MSGLFVKAVKAVKSKIQVMNQLIHKRQTALRRTHRVRVRISGSAKRPRLSVNISNKHIRAQIIDDSKSTTLAFVDTIGAKLEGNMTEKAAWVGREIAAKASKAEVKTVVFDRRSRLYHGRVKSLAEAARAAGLEI